VMIPTGVLSGHAGEIIVIVSNFGANSTEAEVCIEEQCVTIEAIEATLNGPGMSSASLFFDSLPSGSSSVTVQWSQHDQSFSIESITPSIEPAWRENARFLIKIILIAYCAGILFDRRFGNT
jgi:hypothetical protein